MSDLKRELYAIEEKIKELGAEMQKNETKNSKIKLVMLNCRIKVDIKVMSGSS